MQGRRAFALIAILAGVLGLLSSAQVPPPGLTTEFAVETFPVYRRGTLAEPQIATVKLTLRGDFLPSQPFDVIIGVDRTINLEGARPFLDRLLNLLGPDDRVGLVSLAPPTLDSPLTTDFNIIRQRFSELTPSGAAGLADAVAVATKELIETARPEARKVQIWLVARAGLAPAEFGPVLTQAQRARESQITVHVVTTTDEAARSQTLLSLARFTNGLFLKNLTDNTLTALQGQLRVEFIARQIVAKVTVTNRVTFEGAEGNPEIQEFADGSRTLTWKIDAIRPEEIVTLKLMVSSPTLGSFPINRSPSTVEYTNILGQRVRLNLPFLTLDVTNASPIAKFEFNPEIFGIDRATWQPAVRENIVFTDQSSDPDGQITQWQWDFGDGTTSTTQSPTHAYEKAGTYTVTLTVTDNEGATASASASITVINVAIATRDLPTFNGQLPKGIFIRVYLEIRVNRDVLGLGVREEWPKDIIAIDTKVEDVTEKVLGEPHGGTLRPPPPGGTAIEWIFPERLVAGTVKKIAYEVKLSEIAEVDSPTLTGFVISKVPDIQTPTEGTSSFQLVEGLPIKVVVAHYITRPDIAPEEERIDPKDDNLISFNQIQRAVSWWLATGWTTLRESPIVPGTGGRQIDLATMQELIAYWLSNTPVDQPLPPRP
ncbi:MAG: PKD domain-containing protein [Candidatus Bipolaricaulota bacterium]|nr:PKD domain-containing protein [Candidatus Bipolaricaulota bacterium]